jgi:hypothetical protein
MSTKSSVAWGDDFHFYTEMHDGDNVYLRVDKAEFYATKHGVTVTIPRAIWEVIRERAATDLKAAFWTDEQLNLYAKGEEEKQRRRVDQHKRECEPCRSGDGCRVRFFYREPESEEEIAARWRNERTRQREIADRVAAYREGMNK